MPQHREKIDYTPERCDHCKMTLSWIAPIDKGTVVIVQKIARAIGAKGINIVHPRKENVLTATEWTNLSRVKRHGLVAALSGPYRLGNVCLTRKGSAFLRGESIPKYAIVDKRTKHQIGYFQPDRYQVTVSDFDGQGSYWEGINYEITDGHVFRELPAKAPVAPSLF